MSGKKKTNGDEQCKCRLSSLAPHRKKKCSLFGKNGFLVPPDTQIQHAKALDKEVDEEEVDQSPEAVRARIEKAVTDAAGPGVNVTVTVTIETPPQPPTSPTDSDAGTSTEAGPASPPPVPATESDASAGMAGLTLDGGTQVSTPRITTTPPSPPVLSLILFFSYPFRSTTSTTYMPTALSPIQTTTCLPVWTLVGPLAYLPHLTQLPPTTPPPTTTLLTPTPPQLTTPPRTPPPRTPAVATISTTATKTATMMRRMYTMRPGEQIRM